MLSETIFYPSPIFLSWHHKTVSSHKNPLSIRYFDELDSLDFACRFAGICIHRNHKFAWTHEYRKIAPVEMQLHAVLFRWHVSQRDERQWRSHGWPKFACINVWAKWELAVLVERQWNGKLSENGDNRTSCWAKTAGQESRKLFGIPKDSVCRC